MDAKPTINAKVFEPKFNEYLSKLIYAVFDDNKRDWNGPLKYSDLIYQNYQNLLLDKKARCEGLKSRFTVSSEVKQYLTALFAKMIEEIDLIEVTDNDTVGSLTDKLDEANMECYTTFMWGLAARYKEKFGATLKSAGDPTLWFHNQIIGFLPRYATKPIVIALFSSEFDSFLKAIAWLLGKFLWYYEVSVSGELFLGMLAQQSVDQIMLDELNSGLRAKPPVKPRSKKADTSTGAVVNTTNTVAINATVINNETVGKDQNFIDILADM